MAKTFWNNLEQARTSAPSRINVNVMINARIRYLLLDHWTCNPAGRWTLERGSRHSVERHLCGSSVAE